MGQNPFFWQKISNMAEHLPGISSNRSVWVPKNAEFFVDSNSENKIEKKGTNKKLLLKN